MADDDETTIGTWFNQGEQREILEPFDEAIEEVGIASRSAGMKRAMQLYTDFIVTVNEAPWGYFENEHDERFWMRQAVRSELRRESENG